MSKKVLIIGGGPFGFACARALLEESADLRIDILERQGSFGGVWNYDPNFGPMYRDMFANTPRIFMSFTGRPFPPNNGRGTDLYAYREEVKEYIVGFSKEVSSDQRVNVHFSSNVVRVVHHGQGAWGAFTEDGQSYYSDFILVATGHYDVPNWPLVPGLREHPGAIHSSAYDNADLFGGSRTLVIGNARSAHDIVVHILEHTAPVVLSRRNETQGDIALAAGDKDSLIFKPELTRVQGKSVEFADGTSEEFDRIVVCTGYQYDFPFLETIRESLPLLHPKRIRLQNFYKHTFWSGDPSLATLGMNKWQVPFPTAEAQTAVISRVWAGRLELPPFDLLIAKEQRLVEEKGDSEKFHDLSGGADSAFMNELWNWAESAPGGFTAARWTDEQIKLRESLASIKAQELTARVLEAKRKREAQFKRRTPTDSGDSVDENYLSSDRALPRTVKLMTT